MTRSSLDQPADAVAVITTKNPAVQIQVSVVTFPPDTRFLSIAEFEASSSSRRGREGASRPKNFAPTRRVVMLPTDQIPALRAALDQLTSEEIGGAHGG